MSMHECCTITIGHFNHGTCHCANQHHNFTLEITQEKLSWAAVYQEVCTARGFGLGRGAVRYAEGLCPAGWPLCCDFVVHHCPCLMEAWLFLSRCCDNAKCPFYEREGFRPPLYCQHLTPPLDNPPPPLTNTHKQPVHNSSDTR